MTPEFMSQWFTTLQFLLDTTDKLQSQANVDRLLNAVALLNDVMLDELLMHGMRLEPEVV